MNQETLSLVFSVVLLPLIVAVSSFLIQFLQAKRDELKTKVKNETAQKYIDMIADTVMTCVTATTQTYVDSLKAQGKFDAEAQKEAFNRSLQAILTSLSVDAIRYIEEISGDVELYLTQKIEAAVKASK